MPSRYETSNVNVALQVLRTIVPTSQVDGDPTPLRLALRVILPHITDSPALVEFWTIATNKHRLAYQTCIQPYKAIVEHLKRAGFEIEAANDLHSGRKVSPNHAAQAAPNHQICFAPVFQVSDLKREK